MTCGIQASMFGRHEWRPIDSPAPLTSPPPPPPSAPCLRQVEKMCGQWLKEVAEEFGRQCGMLLQTCDSAASLVEVELAVKQAIASWQHPSIKSSGKSGGLKRQKSGGALWAWGGASSSWHGIGSATCLLPGWRCGKGRRTGGRAVRWEGGRLGELWEGGEGVLMCR